MAVKVFLDLKKKYQKKRMQKKGKPAHERPIVNCFVFVYLCTVQLIIRRSYERRDTQETRASTRVEG